MVGYVIDGEGEVWLEGSPAFQRRFGDPAPDFDLAGYAVRNFGCIHMRVQGDAVRFRIQPGAISRKAFFQAVRMMVDDPRDRYIFDGATPAPHLELVRNLNDAVARLEDFVEGAREPRNSIMASELLSLDRLRHPKRRTLRDLIGQWKRLRGRLPDDPLTPFRTAGLLGRAIVARPLPGSGTRIRFFGPQLGVYDPDWAERAIGLDLEDQPDASYGAWSARGYQEVRLAGRPRLELVDAFIREPGKPSMRHRYERLLLPWTAADGAVLVSGASILRTRFTAVGAT
jgi:hypothetical protein